MREAVGVLLEPSGRKLFLAGLLVALALSLAAAGRSYTLASNPRLGADTGYASDETWYVPAARNIARKIFGLNASHTLGEFSFATIVYRSFWDKSAGGAEVRKCLRGGGGFVAKDDYEKQPLMWVAVPEDEKSLVYRCSGGREVIWGYKYPDEERITGYLNTEHPPLAKYAIMASMLLLGDYQLSWRLPSILAYAAIVLLAYLAGWRIAGLLGGLAASILAFQEPILRVMCSLAMLDAQLALWTAAALVATLYDKRVLAALLSGLALATKFPGLFVLVASAIRFSATSRGLREKTITLIVFVLAASAVYLAANAPLIAYLGPQKWVGEQLFAVKWHTSSRPSGPPTSPPWGWLVNYNPFPLNLNPDVYAEVNSPAYLMAALLAALLMDRWRSREYVPLLFFAAILLGFVAVYAAGNKTLYSFYAVQLAPAVHASAATLILEVYRLLALREEGVKSPPGGLS